MAFGIVCGVLEAQRSGKGQVIDVAMVDGTARAHDDDVGPQGDRVLGRGARRQRARHRRAVLRHLRDERRQVRLARFARAAVLRRAHPTARPRKARTCRTRWTATAGRVAHQVHRAVQDQDARRVGRDPRRHRRVLRAGAHDVGGDRATSTSRRAARSSSATASRSPRRRRASRAPRPRCSAIAPWPGQHTDEALADWGFDAAEIAKLRETGAIA